MFERIRIQLFHTQVVGENKDYIRRLILVFLIPLPLGRREARGEREASRE
jgi:hypothetical protein